LPIGLGQLRHASQHSLILDLLVRTTAESRGVDRRWRGGRPFTLHGFLRMRDAGFVQSGGELSARVLPEGWQREREEGGGKEFHGIPKGADAERM